MNVSLVPVPLVDCFWPQIAEAVEGSVSRCDSDLTTSFLWQSCRSGNAFLILAVDDTGTVKAGTIHRFEQYRSGMKLCCLAAWGGNMRSEWYEDMKSAAVKLGVAGGASAFISEGSDAYLRMLPGAKKVRTLFEVPF